VAVHVQRQASIEIIRLGSYTVRLLEVPTGVVAPTKARAISANVV
jgi:hypothetical protein